MIKIKRSIAEFNSNDMKRGQIGIIDDNTGDDIIVIKVYDDILVSLNTHMMWNCSDVTFSIKLLPNGTMLEIENND